MLSWEVANGAGVEWRETAHPERAGAHDIRVQVLSSSSEAYGTGTFPAFVSPSYTLSISEK
jgi:hypothetical protein